MSVPNAVRYAQSVDCLVAEAASQECTAIVVIPARNEEASLPAAFDALRLQEDGAGGRLVPSSYEVIVLLNNCTDHSAVIAHRYAKAHRDFQLHVCEMALEPGLAHVGTARRMLMDTAHRRLCRTRQGTAAILSTDADTVVARDWIWQNLCAIEAGADVVGGVISLFDEDLDALRRDLPEVLLAYERDRALQGLVAQVEAHFDPDPADPWPRHLEHFGASLACTPAIYALAGGLPAVSPLEDVAFVRALRRVGARLRHAPEVRVCTSARLHGRAAVGLSGQLRLWHEQAARAEVHEVDSSWWIEHRFRTMGALRREHRATEEHEVVTTMEETFLQLGRPRRAEITETIDQLHALLRAIAD